MNKPELLAPAGSLEKAILALKYGADAVYVGGKKFSLRARASNFTIDDLKVLCEYAHKNNKRVYVTTNILPHDEDLLDLEDYLKSLEKIGVDAVITSSLYIIKTVQKVAPRMECHISTQMTSANLEAIKFYQNINAKRVVLAREVTLDEIEIIAKDSPLELEVFIHGGMCASYSGRCVLSNHLTNRDANRGGCAHSCRWNYHLYDGCKKINKKKQFFNFGSKDLNAIRYIPKLIDYNIKSLKIEGRMKSSYYLATVVRCYRLLIDTYIKNHQISEEEFKFYESEIAKAENRQTSCGFYEGLPKIKQQIYDERAEEPTKEYVAYVLDYDEKNKTALIEQRNYFETGDILEAFGPNLANTLFVADKLIDSKTNELYTVARHPLQQFYMHVDVKLSKDDMIRKVK